MSIEFLENDFDRVSYLVNLLTSRATGLAADSREFEILRHQLLTNPDVSPYLPQWLKQHRNLDTFWGFIKQKFGTYAERRTYLSEEFTPVLDMLEFGQPAQPSSQVGVRRQLSWPVRVNYDGRLGFRILSGSSLF